MTVREAAPTPLGKAEGEQVLRANLERYRQLALEAGASAAGVISVGDVVIDERGRLKCLVPHLLEGPIRWNKLASDVQWRRLQLLLLREILVELRKLNERPSLGQG